MAAFGSAPYLGEVVLKRSLVAETQVPMALFIGMTLAAIALIGYQYLRLRRRLPLRKAAFLTALRAVSLFVLVAIIAQPSLTIERYQKLRPTVAVMVDVSKSMALGEEKSGYSRMDMVRSFLQKDEPGLEKRLAENFSLNYYAFGKDAKRVSRDEIAGLQPLETNTNIGGALLKASDEAEEGGLAGILMFSDGINNYGFIGDDALKRLGAPVVAIGLGDPKSYKDIAIANVLAPGLAFVHNPLRIEFDIESVGYRLEGLPVVLKGEAGVISTQFIAIDEDDFKARSGFSFVPKKTGTYILNLSAPLMAGDRIKSNNEVAVKVKVVRDKIRVLLISGTPSWNYKFLRQALKGDPSVDLLSFVILRTPLDVVNVPQDELSLIPFPADVIFTEELENFDLVIFDNFSYRYYFPTTHLERLREFVSKGGAFLMLGGDRSFGLGGYAGTPLADVLPVELDGGGAYRESSFKMKLTEKGLSHPVLRLASDARDNAEQWAAMPSLGGFNLSPKAKLGAVVLGVHPFDGNEYGNYPIVAAMRYGQGRTMAILSDYLWRWQFGMVAEKKSDRHYLKIVRQIIRWLVGDPQFSQIKLFAAKDRYLPGEEMQLRAEVIGDEGLPLKDASLTIYISGGEGVKRPLDYYSGERQGEYLATLRMPAEGTFKISAEAKSQGELIGEDEIVITSEPEDAEFKKGITDEELLKKIATMTGGLYYNLFDFDEGATSKIMALLGKAKRLKLLSEERKKIWSTFYAFSLLVGLLSAEWFFRRRFGLK